MPARYLVRFDDICPRMNWTVWNRVEAALDSHGVMPLVAVVPSNCDPLLDVGDPEPRFWDRVRAWQRKGWTIGLHGFEHRYVTQSAGILGRNRYSEFAGLPAAEQHLKLERGLAIFKREGVRADAWVAPAHSFDEATLDALAALGVDTISDGYALRPFVCPRRLLWIPQQLGGFRRMPFGLWTVCLHVNGWTGDDLARFEESLRENTGAIGSFREIRRGIDARPRNWFDDLFEGCFRTARSLRA